MLVQAKPFWALLLTAVMVCSYLPLESGSVLPNHNEPALVLPDRNAYDWSVTVTHASGKFLQPSPEQCEQHHDSVPVDGGGDVAGTLKLLWT